jgi:hypothetical protein
VGGLPESEGLRLWTPDSFGILDHGLPAAAKDFDYPSARGTMQYMAAYYASPERSPEGSPEGPPAHPAADKAAGGAGATSMRGTTSQEGPGLYFGCEDPLGEVKVLGFRRGAVDTGTFAFTVTATPPGAAVAMAPGSAYTVAWPLAVRLFEGDWYDAAILYRQWVLPSAVWTRDGPVALPAWYRQVTTWVNSHWQQVDVFNVTGGDPDVVVPRVEAILERFGLGPGQMALHWYEWDLLGYDEAAGGYYGPCPEQAEFCGFDTNYPDYLEARSGFGEGVARLQAMGVPVVPYINGRIYDQSTAAWPVAGLAGAAKGLRSPTTLANASAEAVTAVGADPYSESYGSLAVFAVMCPHEAGWQETMASTVGSLVADHGVAGVYIDQIGAAGPEPCFDPSHGHELGGGKFWTEGYRDMLSQVHNAAAKVEQASSSRTSVEEGGGGTGGGKTVILTEANAEPYLGLVDVLLTLTAFEADWSLSSTHRMAPAFPAIYGGYYQGAGAEYFQADLEEDDGNGFAAKLCQQFLTGVQLGWMSLGGRDNQVPAMGTYDLLMDPAHDASVAFVSVLSQARASLGDLFFDGRSSRDLPLAYAFPASAGAGAASAPRRVHSGSDLRRSLSHAHRGASQRTPTLAAATVDVGKEEEGKDTASMDDDDATQVQYDSVRGAVWVDDAFDATKGLTVLLVYVDLPDAGHGQLDVSFELNARRFGLEGLESCDDQVEATLVDLRWPGGGGDDGASLGTFKACAVALTLPMDPRTAAAVRIRKV